MASLLAVRAKLDRAQEHAEAFEETLNAYMQGDNFALRSEYHADTGWNDLWIEIRNEPPTERLAIIMADALTNARSALDYLVWQLVLQAGSQTPDDKTMFPVVRDAAKWKEAQGRRLQGVAPRWAREIADRQPFHASDSEMHPLAALDDLNNFCKHRTIPASIHRARRLELPNLQVTPGMKYEFDHPDPPIANGAVLFRVRKEDAGQVALTTCNLELRVGFDDGTHRQWDTKDILASVEETITAFEPAFAD